MRRAFMRDTFSQLQRPACPLLQWLLVMAIALGIGCPRWVRRPLPMPATKGVIVDVAITILWKRSFALDVLTTWRTIAFRRLATQPIVIYPIPVSGHTHLSMLRSSERIRVCALGAQRSFISDHRARQSDPSD
jgi:hypothetical protein